MAVHLYTASRVTTDVDAEFGGRVHIPNDLMVEVTLENGVQQVIYLDTNYNSTFALMHEDYQADSIPVDLGLEHIRVHVLYMDTSHLPREIACDGRQEGCSFISGLLAGRTCWPRWNPLTHASFSPRAISPKGHSGLVSPGLTCLPSHSTTLRNLFTCPSIGNLLIQVSRGSRRFDAHVTLLVWPIVGQKCPDCPRYLVCQRYGYHIRRPTFSDLLDPRSWLFCVREYRPGAVYQ
jgi:hypothetical protein